MRHLDLFSGIGGFALAASWVWGDEHEIVSFVEIDPFCQKVLKKHWPDVPIISDIRDVKNERFMADSERKRRYAPITATRSTKRKNGKSIATNQGRQEKIAGSTKIDVLTGGFPCQPFSVAGKQRSKKDDRYLWPEMLRIIQEFRPTWIIGENVAGIINLALDQVLSDLESASYEVQSFLIPACAVDAPHRRDRVWIVAYNADTGLERMHQWKKLSDKANADTNAKRFQKWQGKNTEGKRENSRAQPVRISKWIPEPNVGRVANGIPRRVDRLRSLGNAIVPQVVVPIMQAIKEIETRKGL